jgi:CheY-like chemotaxis protein
MNLIGNAYKFTPSGKSIDFSVTYDGGSGHLSVSVKDTGIGIPEAKQQEIFEAFSQAEETTALEYGGTGLGLAISAQYVAEMGGRLQLKSRLDEGSTFFFNIPVEVVKNEPRFNRLPKQQYRIDILLDRSNTEQARNLMRYLMRFGIARDQMRAITKADDVNKYTTHLAVFQKKLDDEAMTFLRTSQVPAVVVEEELFSLTSHPVAELATVLSAYGFYAKELYDSLQRRRELRILVVDDDRINFELIKAIVEEEMLEVERAQEGYVALELMKNALNEGRPFGLAYLDKHMPDMSGVEVMREYRAYERAKGAAPLFAISISGDPVEDKEARELFDLHMGKPFKKKEVKESLARVLR